MRDAALAAAVYLSKQDVKKFFPEAAKVPITDPQQLFFNARVIGFSNDEDRAEAFKKWADSAGQRNQAEMGKQGNGKDAAGDEPSDSGEKADK